MKTLFIACFAGYLGLFSLLSVAQGKTYFRYKNEQGVQVMSDAIPVKYATKGYQIVDIYGRVVKEIPPELSPEEKERLREELEEKRRLEIWDKELIARYSNIEDIRSAKKRRLREMDTNIFTLQLTLNNISDKIKGMQADAASQERSGTSVSEDLLNTIEQLQKDKTLIEEEITQKDKDKANIANRYDRDMERFMIIRPPKQALESPQ